jgi:AraC-like DNA-binding protein
VPHFLPLTSGGRIISSYSGQSMESAGTLQNAGFGKPVAHDSLSLVEVVLRPGEEWVKAGEGLFLAFPRKGEVYLFAGQASRLLTPGDASIVSQTGGSVVRLVAQARVSLRCFSIHPEQLYPLFSAEEIPLIQGTLNSFKEIRLFAAAEPTAKDCHKALDQIGTQSELCRRTDLLRIAAVVLSEQLKQDRRPDSGYVRPDEHLARVLENLKAEDIMDLSASELAVKFSLSRRHLNRLFHEHFGVSVGTLKMEMRLLKAMSLLRDPNAKVLQVAEQSGFNHLGLFNTCFKRRFGVTPSESRKLILEPQTSAQETLRADSACTFRATGLCAWFNAGGPKTTAGSRKNLAGQTLPAGS